MYFNYNRKIMKRNSNYNPLTMLILDALGILSNVFMFGVIAYVVFILGYSGWWFAFYLVARFYVEWGKE
jgi:hypothetical protein